MRPDRRGKSRWVKLNPWYYTEKRKRSRQAERRIAVDFEVSINPQIRFGRPAVGGISVEAVQEQAESGASEEEIASDYGLTVNSVRAALAYKLQED